MHPELNPMTADNSPQTFNSLVVYALSVQQNFLTGMLISVDSSEKLSNCSNIIAHYYIESIRKYGVYPRRVRADMGAENVHVETIRKFLRRIHGDEHASEKILLYGKSINNQRIESLWGIKSLLVVRHIQLKIYFK
jgi:hypothetical protein